MDAERLAGIRRRCAVASPGPWVIARMGKFQAIWSSGAQLVVETFERIADGNFICKARTDIPDLLAALAESEADKARLEAQIAELRTALEAAQFLYEEAEHDRLLARWEQP